MNKDYLKENEVVLWEGFADVKNYIIRNTIGIVFTICTLAVFWGTFMRSGASSEDMKVIKIWCTVMIAICVIMVIPKIKNSILEGRASSYVVTDRRIILLYHDSVRENIYYEDIEKIRLKRKGGTIEIIKNHYVKFFIVVNDCKEAHAAIMKIWKQKKEGRK